MPEERESRNELRIYECIIKCNHLDDDGCTVGFSLFTLILCLTETTKNHNIRFNALNFS